MTPSRPGTDTKQRRRKVKTGCLTCKKRKVRCDEGRPACQFCLSTGRVCDGYGIWGGGGNRYEQRSANTTALSHLNKPIATSKSPPKLHIRTISAACPFGTMDQEECGYFEYFACRTSRKLSSVLGSSIWDNVVLQACANEPAVLHAVLALASAHKRKDYASVERERSLVLPDQQEKFLLRHYNKAIEYLQPQYLPIGKQSVRTVLVACLLFYYIELLRGKYASSYTHLQSGLRLAVAIGRPAKGVVDKQPSLQSEALDENFYQTFTRLQVLRALAAHYLQGHGRPPHAIYNALPLSKFPSAEQARSYLGLIFESIDRMTKEYHQVIDQDGWPTSFHATLINDRSFTQAALDEWRCMCDATTTDISSEYEAFEFQLLRPYHTMATIMAATCLSFDGQIVFDYYTSMFASIIAQSVDLTENAKRLDITSSSNHSMESSWISPIHYTAQKCRDYTLRVQAIKLLSSV
jgi:hypothetical protein